MQVLWLCVPEWFWFVAERAADSIYLPPVALRKVVTISFGSSQSRHRFLKRFRRLFDGHVSHWFYNVLITFFYHAPRLLWFLDNCMNICFRFINF